MSGAMLLIAAALVGGAVLFSAFWLCVLLWIDRRDRRATRLARHRCPDCGGHLEPLPAGSLAQECDCVARGVAA